MSIQWFDQAWFEGLSATATETSRKRKNFNLHESQTAPAQRLFNALEPGSYVVPHRHLAPGKEETLIMVRGCAGLILFDEAGHISLTRRLLPASECTGFHLGLGTWHSVVALEPGSVFFEVKEGPYQPLTADEFAPWAPRENTPHASAYQQQLAALFV